jgi:hypothetical protein
MKAIARNIKEGAVELVFPGVTNDTYVISETGACGNFRGHGLQRRNRNEGNIVSKCKSLSGTYADSETGVGSRTSGDSNGVEISGPNISVIQYVFDRRCKTFCVNTRPIDRCFAEQAFSFQKSYSTYVGRRFDT